MNLFSLLLISAFAVAATESLGAATESPGAATESPGAATESPGAATESPGAVTQSPGAATSAVSNSTKSEECESLKNLQITKVEKFEYHYHTSAMKNFNDAQRWCGHRGMKLAIPKTRADLNLIYKYSSKKSDYYWVGAKYYTNTGFQWEETSNKDKVADEMWESMTDTFIRPRIDVSVNRTHNDLLGTCAFMSAPFGSLWYADCNTLHFFVCKVRKHCLDKEPPTSRV